MRSIFSGLRDHRAFSLVELLLYVGILGIVGGLLTGILTTATKTQVQQTSQDKLSGELSFAMSTIQRLVQSSSLIDADAGTASSGLKLRMENLAQDPTLIYLSNGTIYIQQGSSTPQALTDGAVSVSSLQFQKFSQYPGKDVVQIDIAINDANQPTALARSLRSAVSRASAATFDSPLLPGSNTYSIGTTGSPWNSGYFSGTVGIALGGLLGIGTLTPSYPLDIETANNGIFVSSTATTSNSFLMNLQAGSTTALYVRNDGNIGIGTSTPAYGVDIYNTFHVAGTSTFNGNIVMGGSTSTPIYRISNVATPATSTDVATKGYVDGLTAGGGIPSGYMILGSATSTAPSGYTAAGTFMSAPFWKQRSSATYPNEMIAATTGLDGNIYVIGGMWNQYATSSMYAYNPFTDTWTQKASLPYTFTNGQAATGPDGRIYAIGGYANGSGTSTVEAYTPSTNSWAQVASMPVAFTSGAATTGLDGNIYVTGGGRTTFYIYNTTTNTWSIGSALPGVVSGNASTLGADGSIYVTGGSATTSFYAYKGGTWTTKAPLPQLTYGTNLVTGSGGNLYMFGGYSTSGATSTVLVYSPLTGAWSTGTPPLPYALMYIAPVVGGDGLAYIIGGRTSSGYDTSTVLQYNQSIYQLYTKN